MYVIIIIIIIIIIYKVTRDSCWVELYIVRHL